jgi:hypothetical protein
MIHNFKRAPLIILTLFFAASPVFSASMPEIGKAWAEFAEDNSGRLIMSADLGLGWSDAYIGQLIDMPPHYGFGLTFGMNSLKTEKLNALTNALGLKKLEPWFAEKQFFPGYVIETRVGGFRDLPFDVGFKVGYLPALVEMFGDLQYENLLFGGDFRYNLSRGFGWSPEFSVGFGVNYLTGYFLKTGYTGAWGDDLAGGGSDLRITWNTLSFLLKLIVSKSLLFDRITLFAGLNGGFAISETGLALVGDKFTWGGQPVKDLSMGQYSAITSALKGMGNNSEWEIKDNYGNFGAWGKITKYTPSLHTYEGISFDFDNSTHLQVAIMFDFLHLEFGLSVGYRWQQ